MLSEDYKIKDVMPHRRFTYVTNERRGTVDPPIFISADFPEPP
jgi:hypothetical protein